MFKPIQAKPAEISEIWTHCSKFKFISLAAYRRIPIVIDIVKFTVSAPNVFFIL